MYKVKNLIIVILWIPVFVLAQTGGQYGFDALRLVPSARITALGGINISTSDYDPLMAAQNPALSNDQMHGMFSMTWSNALADIRYGQAAYSHRLKNVGNLYGGVQFVNYGDFIRTDALANQTGTFTAGTYKFSAGASRAFDQWRFGAGFHYLSARIDGMQSGALSVDMGAMWQDTSRFLNAGFVLKNLGSQIGRYSPNQEKADLPFEIQAGISKRLEHLPVRFSLTAIQLNRFMNLLYQNPDAPIEYDLSGQPIPVKKRTADKIARHFVLGAELSVSKSFFLRAGYNHQRRQELKTLNQGGLSGFGMGAGIRVSWFTFDYGFGRYHAASNLHQFTLAMALTGPIKGLR